MIEALYMTWEILAAAKLEIGVFFLAALLHFLLFSNRAPVKLSSKAKLDVEKSEKNNEKTAEKTTIARALRPMLRSGTSKATFEAELRATLTKVPASERQKTLATALESLGRQVEPELLSAMRSVTGAVTELRLAEQLLRGYLSVRSRTDFEELLRDVEKAQTQKGELLPNGIAVLAVQFALAGENLEAALARLPGIAGEARTTNGSTKSNWELLDKVMTEFLPLIDDPHAIHVCFHRILDTLVKSDSTHAWEVLKRMEAAKVPPNNVTCSILLKGVHKEMKEDYLKKVMAVIDNRAVKEMDEVLLGSLYEACIRCGQVKKLLNYVQKLREESGLVTIRSAHTVGSIIRAHGVNEDLDGVWTTWNNMKSQGVVPSRITLGCMVEALASNNDADGAYEVIQEALADPQTANLVNAVTYSSVLKSFNHQKRFHRVWDVYDEMIRQKVEFSVTTYNALLDVCARSGEIARAEPLLKDMAQQGISPNIITYGTVIKAYCSANRLDQAFAVLSEMQANTDLHPDEVTYNTLLDGCARYGLFDRGLEVLAETWRDRSARTRAGVAPSNYTLSVIAKLANRSKKPKMAFEMVFGRSIWVPLVVPLSHELWRSESDLYQGNEFGIKLNMHVYNNLIHAATCDNDMAKAQETFAAWQARSYTLLLRFCVTRKSHVPAVALLRTAIGLQTDSLQTESLHPALSVF
ncbi:Pentatricopeptide repeat-containing protein At5g61990 [Durusdinium trenchii]|uniref:Mitochondrial n=1 Tax=Durusdinium trenchii TaxID=1381693 RepID=A0ABP0R7Y3_9DINO